MSTHKRSVVSAKERERAAIAATTPKLGGTKTKTAPKKVATKAAKRK